MFVCSFKERFSAFRLFQPSSLTAKNQPGIHAGLSTRAAFPGVMRPAPWSHERRELLPQCFYAAITLIQ
jgi:hypothetical protein